eukprot:TRINITY_DN11122_c0_g1_i4.p1 TRINITY_DN11122_c0_g1~~TRINITY_DN11122_c0_g1_i4.p1  ORF type:complete len:102 (-),score=4.16 TRINITY_DN11122_c0_g1_i4:270-575(-)
MYIRDRYQRRVRGEFWCTMPHCWVELCTEQLCRFHDPSPESTSGLLSSGPMCMCCASALPTAAPCVAPWGSSMFVRACCPRGDLAEAVCFVQTKALRFDTI